jgi:hypothetical protein
MDGNRIHQRKVTMNLFTLIVAALATWHIVEVWHHGSIFASWRARVDLWEGFFGELLRCPFCLSVWVAGLSTGWFFLTSAVGYDVLAWPLYLFAVARLANLGNDVSRDLCRTPKPQLDFDVEAMEEDDETQK